MAEDLSTKNADDSAGNLFHEEAKNIRESHGYAVNDQKDAELIKFAAEKLRASIDESLKQVHDEDPEKQDEIERQKAKVNRALEPVFHGWNMDVADDIDAVNESITESAQHLADNRELYEQAALEDARAAGHDVSFGSKPESTPDTQLPPDA